MRTGLAVTVDSEVIADVGRAKSLVGVEVDVLANWRVGETVVSLVGRRVGLVETAVGVPGVGALGRSVGSGREVASPAGARVARAHSVWWLMEAPWQAPWRLTSPPPTQRSVPPPWPWQSDLDYLLHHNLSVVGRRQGQRPTGATSPVPSLQHPSRAERSSLDELGLPRRPYC